ncbi:MAG: tandem-95 repeat protein [Anaerolineae bacterium]|nr:tandem-95 repeat protein [Anaerolineae bacterium]
MPRQAASRTTAVHSLSIILVAAVLFVLLASPALAQVTAVDDYVFTFLNTPFNIDVLANDNPFGSLSIASNTNVSNGILNLQPDNTFDYAPATGFSGTDSFTYTATDGTNTSSATVYINVANGPNAGNDTYSTVLNTPLTITSAAGLLANDQVNGAGSLVAELVTGIPATQGVLVLDPTGNGAFTYTPLAGFSGDVTFTYQARRSDGIASSAATVTITVSGGTIIAQNDSYTVTANTVYTVAAPGVLLNDSGPGGPLTALLVAGASSGTVILNSDGSFTYTPQVGFTGVANFQYRATQGSSQSNIATVTLNITGGIIATATPLITLTPVPTATATRIPLFIPGPTPVPQAVPNGGQLASLVCPPVPTDVTVVVNRDGVNVRLFPAIGAEVLGFLNAGYDTEARARSADNQWVKVEFSGDEGWVGFPVITLISGNLESLPVEDPRTVPYGGFGCPRAGLTGSTSAIAGILRDSGVRVRSGPSRSYVVLANAPRGSVFPILGRTYNNAWFQVNFNGVLGWVIAREVELQSANFTDIPLEGIVADALPISQPTTDNYIGTLKLLLSRLNLAQESLDAARQRWTDAALTGTLACGYYPPSPTDQALANPLAAAFNDTLVPLVNDFNAAMALVRVPVDLLLSSCTESRGTVGQPQIQIALQAISDADGLFTALRQRLSQLIPPDREIGPDDCPFSFARQTDILPRLGQGQLAVVRLTGNNYVVGFCVDAAAGQQLRVEALAFQGNARPSIAVSPYDNPTNFIGLGRASGDNQLVTVGPILIDRTGVYLVIISDFNDERTAPLDSQVALLVTDISAFGGGGVQPGLYIDPNTGQLIANPNPSRAIQGTNPLLDAFATPASGPLPSP